MPIRRSVTPAVLLAVSLAPPAAAQRPTPPQSVESATAQTQTIRDMRTVGTALFAWLADQVTTAESNESTYTPDVESGCISRHKGGACDSADFDRVPLISHAELTRLLVPDYIESIPEKDGWGNPYEYRLDRQHVFNTGVLAIRSTGSDGTFSGHRYESGTFSPLDTVEDLVWMDGFFLRWPERKDAQKTQEPVKQRFN